VTRPLAAAALLLLLASPPVAAGQAGPFGPTPAGKALVLMADESVSAEALAPVILEAASKRWTYRLFPRLLDVLEEWVREEPARLPLVLDAFGQAAVRVRSEAAAEALVDAGAELRGRLAAPPTPRTPREGWVRPRPGDGVPVPWAVEGVSRRELRERRRAYVDARLPKGDRGAYVKTAFEAFLAPSCASYLGGETGEVCPAVGLVALRWAALEAGLAGLSGDGTEPGLVDAYLAAGPDLTTRVLDEVAYGFPSVTCEACVLLRSWLRRRPTRWQVRAALEPELEQ